MSMINSKFKIKNMTCINCENRILKEIRKMEGVKEVSCSYKLGELRVSYNDDLVSDEDILKVLNNLNYIAQKDGEKPDYIILTGVFGILIIAYLILNNLGMFKIFNNIPTVSSEMEYTMLFVVGLMTSVHCVAMCSGINISQSMNKKNGIKSGAMYNFGRVISYTVIGGLVGLIGEAISFSDGVKGGIQVAAGVFMLIMGMNIFGYLNGLKRYIPVIKSKKMAGLSYKFSGGKAPFVVGLLNGFMPCGPLQSMMIYALSTGSLITGSLSMFFFSLGTVPLMMLISVLSSFINGKRAKIMMISGGVVLILLAINMTNNGLSMLGIKEISIFSNTDSEISSVNEDGIQVVKMDLSARGYDEIVVKKGVPVKWIINVDESSLNGCNYRFYSEELNISKELKIGENIVEFTPKDAGEFRYYCWMGMISSSIIVE